MTDRIKDGGPAFPTEPMGPAHGRNYDGMTLRDWFAGQALTGVMGRLEGEAESPEQGARFVTDFCYLIADAMLEARK